VVDPAGRRRFHRADETAIGGTSSTVVSDKPLLSPNEPAEDAAPPLSERPPLSEENASDPESKPALNPSPSSAAAVPAPRTARPAAPTSTAPAVKAEFRDPRGPSSTA